MKQLELRKLLGNFQKDPKQEDISKVKDAINEAYRVGEIRESTRDTLLKDLFSIASSNGLFMLQLKNIEVKEGVEIIEDGEEDDYYEESYEESYDESYDEEEEDEE